MPAVDPVLPKAKAKKPVKVRVTVPDAGEQTRTRRQPAVRTPPSADTGDRARSNPVQETGKMRMYAHPQRPAAQKVFRQQAQDEADAAKKAKALKKTVAKIKVTPVPSPDARDSLRSPQQQAKDAAAVNASVQSSRVKALRAQEAGSGTRAVKAFLKSNVADEVHAKTTDIHGHGGSKFAVIAANLPVAGFSSKVIANAGKDAAELAVTTPSSVAKLASTAVHDPKKVPKLLAQPYIDFAHAPLKTAEEKPVSTALMLAPAGRLPGRIAGRVARKTGAQTLARPTAKLAGTALEEARIGSRDFAVRAHQAKRDAANPNPTVTEKQIKKRADAHYDQAKHIAHQQVGEATRAASKAAKGQPKAVRVAAVDAARVQAQEDARVASDTRLAKEFGANVRLSHGVAVREALHKVRRQAVGRLDTAKATAKQANEAHKAAWQGLRDARARARVSPQLRALEFNLRDAQRDLAAEQRAAVDLRVQHGRAAATAPYVRVPRLPTSDALKAARGAVSAADRRLNRLGSEVQRAEEKASRLEGVSIGRVKGGKMTVGAGKQIADHQAYMGALRDEVASAQRAAAKAREGLKAAEAAEKAAQKQTARGARATRAADVRTQGGAARTAQQARISQARQRIADLNRQIADEHARPLPPLHPARQAFTNAIQARGQAHAALATAKADAHAAAHAHIAARQAMTNATLVDPAKEGRLFAHKADAATVVKKLNQTAVASGAAKPITFVLHQVGQDRWAAVPKVARQRLYGEGKMRGGEMGHYSVGTGKATFAKGMRVSRGAFTNATLPFSLKWLGGQGAEAGIRAAVAGAGPMDWLRVGKVVKKMNAQKAGSGDELAHRLTGGQFGLTGPARDFANGKSLAEEFEGTPVARGANAASAVGRTAPARAVKSGWGHYTHAVFGVINHVIESNARRAMAGQAIKDLGFQDTHWNGLFDKAIEDAASKLHGTHNQIALARKLNQMYGKYSGFSPEMRSVLMHWTPFLPWYLNAASFLFKVLPVDHPVKAALLADISSAEGQWRKDHGLDPWEPGHAPNFLLGSYPTKGDGHLNIAHYTPWGVGSDPTGAIGSLLLPQVSGPVANAAFGVDWKGEPLTVGGSHGPRFNTGQKALRTLATIAEEQVPGATQLGHITGVTPRYVDKDTTVPSAGAYLKKQLPWTPIASGSTSSGASGAAPSGRVKIPGVGSSGRVKIPGVTGGRVKIP